MADYPLWSRALHRIALDPGPVRQVTFDLDRMAGRKPAVGDELERPVYVAGLARAGTTIVLEALYATGAFASLTYRDMPFVLAPRLWRRLSSAFLRNRGLRERAHGDRLAVDVDSPEAFEEVFWKTFLGPAYVRDEYLEPHEVDDEVLWQYRRYVAHILESSAGGRALRYLAKNNNNVLRMSALEKAFPQGSVVVPVRHPAAHARSLLRQHERFRELHERDPFARRYMEWLGHYEFGSGFRPFRLSDDALPASSDEPEKLSYWHRYWHVVHRYLLDEHRDWVIFLDYDGLCERPQERLRALAEAVGVDPDALAAFADRVEPGPSEPARNEPALPYATVELYERLRSAAV